MKVYTIHRAAARLASVLVLFWLCGIRLGTAVGQAHPISAPTPMSLSDGQVAAFLNAVDALRAGKSGWKDADPSQPMAMALALQDSAEANAILAEHGFAGPTEFRHVAYNVSMAYAVLKAGGKDAIRASVDRANAELEKAMTTRTDRLSEAQLQVLTGRVNDAMMAAATAREVPDANIELMQKHRERMAKLGGT